MPSPHINPNDKQNCPNCRYFSFYEGSRQDGEGPNGYYCDVRESAHKRMNAADGAQYIERGKRCFERVEVPT